MNESAFQKFLATGEYVLVEDVKPASLEAHDKQFHPNGYKEGDSCKFRESMAKKDNSDDLSSTAPSDKNTDVGKGVSEELAFLEEFLGDKKAAKEELDRFHELEQMTPGAAEHRDLSRMEWIYGDSPQGKKLVQKVRDAWNKSI